MKEHLYSVPMADVVYKNNILTIKYKGQMATLAEMQAFIANLSQEFEEVFPALVLSDISNQKSPTKEVRDYMASPEVLKLIKVGAIVANSTLSKIVGNLFLMFNKPTMPTKIFTDEVAALAWLQQFK